MARCSFYSVGVLDILPTVSGVTHMSVLFTYSFAPYSHRLIRNVDVLHRVLTVENHLRLKDESLEIGVKVNHKSTIITLYVSQLKLAVSPDNANAVFLLWSPPQCGHFLGLIATDNGNLYPETVLSALGARIVIDASGVLAVFAILAVNTVFAIFAVLAGNTVFAVLAVFTLSLVVGLDTINVPVTIRTDCYHTSRLAILAIGTVFTILAIGTIGEIECAAIAQCHSDTRCGGLHISDHRSLLNEGLQFLRHLLDRTHAIGKVVDVAFIILTGYESTCRQNQ